MRLWILTFLIVTGSIVSTKSTASTAEDVVHLDVIGGDTAFIVNKQAQKAWWVVGECRRPIPLETSNTQKTSVSDRMTSQLMSEVVSLGSRQIRLQQQFRFDLATPGNPSVEIYSSVRGGWSPVDVQVNQTCSLDVICRQRAEFPEC